jgi:hypothetical protein
MRVLAMTFDRLTQELAQRFDGSAHHASAILSASVRFHLRGAAGDHPCGSRPVCFAASAGNWCGSPDR